MQPLDYGRLYHCKEESTGCTGQFSITDSAIKIKLFDYNEFFHVKSGVVYHARLEDSRTVSLYDRGVARPTSSLGWRAQSHARVKTITKSCPTAPDIR